ncbi:hypothetical protein CEUSTIGMA_g13681.t1 [Chlamydomonas eustigma]|uniref:Protein kinase domain-containing protein n=1 Tax=Chlamydomonas eustigma TaxID=1157962 RepID=A0A250XTI0_9CHLO|nr:hypothetical protein CEUSTIGMA_g13681.t1 [Chlamydomonas eustigma]|eukprot:GAX86269.1 hypothetical protein CEUSTIGMA_g13681.t1 [Chlamydomonas eustigma]
MTGVDHAFSVLYADLDECIRNGMDQRPRSYWATVVSMRESESGLSGYLIERFGIKTGDLRQDDAHVLARRLREFFEGAVPATAPAMGTAGLMGPSYRDEIMEKILEMKRELKTELQGQIWSSRAGALGTTSYEQYYAQKNIRTKGIDQIFPGLRSMPPVDEDHLGTIASHSCRPLLPGKESSENNEMFPGFLKALMSLDGAEGGTFSFNTLKAILDALSHMHLKLKLVHRDIEPKHMGLDAQGVPCLIDVGSAASMDETTANEILSGARPYYSGTLLFASDEVLDGLESECVCVPKAAQDMVALVKSAYIMVHAGAEQAS